LADGSAVLRCVNTCWVCSGVAECGRATAAVVERPAAIRPPWPMTCTGREDDVVVRHSISRLLPCLTLKRERPLPFLYRGPRATATRAAPHLGSQGCVRRARPGGCRGQPSPRGRERCFVNEGPQCLVLSCSSSEQDKDEEQARCFSQHTSSAEQAGALFSPLVEAPRGLLQPQAK